MRLTIEGFGRIHNLEVQMESRGSREGSRASAESVLGVCRNVIIGM